jgi:hypothetical protein
VTGLVLVSPPAPRKPELDDASLLLRISPVPTLGLIAHGNSRQRHQSKPWNLLEKL